MQCHFGGAELTQTSVMHLQMFLPIRLFSKLTKFDHKHNNQQRNNTQRSAARSIEPLTAQAAPHQPPRDRLVQ
jgi:hypothetical protein